MESGMPTMQVSVLRGVGQIGIEERPAPEAADDEVVVRIGSVGVCGSDVHYYEHGRIGPYVVDSPLVLGHEAGGVVTAVGAAVTALQVGQRVSLEPGVPCRRCLQCSAGRYNLCPDVRFFATPPYDGAFSQLVAMPASFVFPVPDTMSDDAAGLIEPLSVGVWACRRGGVSPGQSVLVTGAGPIGLIAAQTARAYGADTVTVTDVNQHRLRVAESLGLVAVDVSQTSLADAGVEADVLLECSGNPRATWDAVSTMARAGRVVLVGMGGDTVQLPLSYVQDRELTITGAFRYANTWPTAIRLAASGRVDLDAMVTGHYGLHDVEAALTASRDDPTSMKSIVRPGE
jgi:L-iditol 2-dehydrogenase